VVSRHTPAGYAGRPTRCEPARRWAPTTTLNSGPRTSGPTTCGPCRRPGVTIVSLGVFAWAHLQPTEDTYDFGWLDEVMDLLHARWHRCGLANATASPPSWLTMKHPEILPVDPPRRHRVAGRPTALAPDPQPGLRTRRAAGPTPWHSAAPIARRWPRGPRLQRVGSATMCTTTPTTPRAFRDWLRSRYGQLRARGAR